MINRVVIFIFIFLGSHSIVSGEPVDCDNYESNLIEKINQFDGGKDLSLGKQERLVTWKDVFDPFSLDGVDSVACGQPKLRDSCWGESFYATLYKNNIIVERGLSNDWYLLHNDFPELPNGIKPGLSKEAVILILGKPYWELENSIQYQSPKTKYKRIPTIDLFFVKGKLSLISFRIWKNECIE